MGFKIKINDIAIDVNDLQSNKLKLNINGAEVEIDISQDEPILEADGEHYFTFGMYKNGESIRSLMKTNPNYVFWLAREGFDVKFRQKLQAIVDKLHHEIYSNPNYFRFPTPSKPNWESKYQEFQERPSYKRNYRNYIDEHGDTVEQWNERSPTGGEPIPVTHKNGYTTYHFGGPCGDTTYNSNGDECCEPDDQPGLSMGW